MSRKFLKVQALVVTSAVSIAVLLFAAQRHDSGVLPQFRTVVDLTGSGEPLASRPSPKTAMIAPAQLGGAWTLETIPTNRLIAPLAVIEAQRKTFADSESLVTMDDVAYYERVHGAIPQGAVVLMSSVKENVTPLLNNDALHFLVEARKIVGIGSAGVQQVSRDENPYLAKSGIYELGNVSNLSLVPRSGAVLVVAPQKIPGAPVGPARLMAMVK